MEKLKLSHKAVAEGIGTFAIVFAGCGSVMVSERFPGMLSAAAIPLVFGLVVAAMIYAVGHISGAHFNPAVTLAFAIARHFPRKEVFAYGVAQMMGAVIAISLLFFLLPPGAGFGETVFHVTPLQALGWEFILTFFLMFVIIAQATDSRVQGVMAGAAIGATVLFCAYVGGPVTGASMNPARSLAPALFKGECGGLWVYFVGPALGAICAALTYEMIRCDSKTKSAKGCC